MRWVAIGVVVIVVVLFLVRLLGTTRKPRPDENVGQSWRIFHNPPHEPEDRSRDE